MGSCVGIMMGILLTDNDVVDDLVFVMPFWGVTNPLESDGKAKEASNNCKRIIFIIDKRYMVVVFSTNTNRGNRIDRSKEQIG